MITTVLLPLIFFSKLIHQRNNTFLTLFIWNFFISAMAEIILLVYHLNNFNNLLVVNIFSFVQFGLLAFALLELYPISKSKKYASIVIVLFIAFAISRMLFLKLFTELDSVSDAIGSVILFTLAGIGLIQVAKFSDVILMKNYKFWFISSCFIYFSISTVVFSTENIFLDNKLSLRLYTYVINSLLTISSNIFYFIGIKCLTQTTN